MGEDVNTQGSGITQSSDIKGVRRGIIGAFIFAIIVLGFMLYIVAGENLNKRNVLEELASRGITQEDMKSINSTYTTKGEGYFWVVDIEYKDEPGIIYSYRMNFKGNLVKKEVIDNSVNLGVVPPKDTKGNE